MDSLPPHMRPEKSFQGFILALQRFWADQGCVLLQLYAVEMGPGPSPPAPRIRGATLPPRSAADAPLAPLAIVNPQAVYLNHWPRLAGGHKSGGGLLANGRVPTNATRVIAPMESTPQRKPAG